MSIMIIKYKMAHLIDESALVSEINRLITELVEEGEDTMFEQGRISAFEDAKLFIDTLEVKEVDLEKDVESYWKQCDLSWCIDAYNMTHVRSMLSDIAKHFFELGLKVQKGE